MPIARWLTPFFFVFLFAGSVLAAGLGAPKGPVLLTVSGEISGESGAEVFQFDRDMLQSLDWQEIRTFTSFTEGEQVFAGPTLASLLQAVGATGQTITATAINDYAVDIPFSDATQHNVILAMDWNGAPMRIRDKGPIWVVYPLSEGQAQRQLFDAQMIWQLNRLSIQ